MDYQVYGYSCVPPTPFALKDWQRYDVSHFVDPGVLAPEEGRLTAAVSEKEIRDHNSRTILKIFAPEIPLIRPFLFFMRRPIRPAWIAPPWMAAKSTAYLWMFMWAALPLGASSKPVSPWSLCMVMCTNRPA